MILNIQPSSCLPIKANPGLTFLFTVVCLFFCGTFAEAGWFVDTEKFHVSAHGQLSCQDCHTEMVDGRLHPDPSHVNKELKDFFNPEQCMACHDNVEEELEENQHGGQEVIPTKSYENCIECHHPHQTSLSGDGSDNLDPEKPLNQQCGVCHELQAELPLFAEDDETCLNCHRLEAPDTPDAAETITERCFHCHANTGTEAQKITARGMALITPDQYRQTAHANLACTVCHQQAAAFPHGGQQIADCGQCHLPHPESITHDVHSTVACQACHLPDVKAVRETEGGRIIWEKKSDLDAPLKIHEMIVSDDEANCRRCHSRGNSVGASAMVLPPKSVICMPCHTATLSFGDTITVVSLVVFSMGLGMSLLLIFSVSSGRKKRAGLTIASSSETERSPNPRSRNRVRIAYEMVLAILFQKRLFEHSPGRWFIHGLLFFPMVLRFLWGIVVLSGSHWGPQWQWVWQMIDKNSGATALFFDLTGVMILSGVLLAFSRHLFERPREIAGLPRRSYLALVLLGGIVLTGFILEGMRIAMTGATGSAAYAFVGFGISKLFPHPEMLRDVYGYGWYVHAVLTGAFICFLPFSRLLHIILSPVVIALNATTRHE